MTAETALRLEAFFGIEAEAWMAMQAAFELYEAEQELSKELDQIRKNH